MNRRLIRLLGGTLGLIGISIYGVGPASAADQTFAPVRVCNGPAVTFTGYGQVANIGVSTAYLFCGIGQDKALDTNDDLVVRFIDQNNISGANVLCVSNKINFDYTTTLSSGFKFGCGTAGGCATDPGAFTSLNQYLTIPDITHGGAFSTAVYCTIPAISGSNASGIVSFVLDNQ